MFTHLHTHSFYSFSSGTIPANELPVLAASKGMTSVALTDTNNLTGVIEFYIAAKNLGIKPIIGVELLNAEERVVLLSKNNNGYKEICQMVTEVLKAIPQIKPKITYDSISKTSTEQSISTLRKSLLPFLHSLSDDVFILTSTPFILKDLAKKKHSQLYIELIASERHNWPLLRTIYNNLSIPIVASNNVVMASKSDYELHRTLRAIGLNTNLGLLPNMAVADPSQYFASEKEMQSFLRGVSDEAFLNTQRIADQCTVEFDFSKPKFATYNCENPQQLLKTISEKGLWNKYSNPSLKHIQRFSYELSMIDKLGATSYFLAVNDLIEQAKRKNYPFLTRGSGANSFIAYCLGICNVDPIENNLRFERFLNPERLLPPDFDIDFSWKDRYEMIHYMLDKYGRDQSAMLATIQTYKDKGAIREIGKAMGFTEVEINTFYPRLREFFFSNDTKRIDPTLFDSTTSNKLGDLSNWLTAANKLLGFPHHLSVHAGGVIIADKEIANYSPTQMSPVGVPILQLDMYSAEDWKLVKLDILATRGLGTYWDTLKLIEQRTGKRPPVEDVRVALNDERTKQMIRTGKTKGVFYIESPAMLGLLRKLKVDSFTMLTAASSVIRPGVASSGMMQEFIARHHDKSRITYPHKILGELLNETYGIMIYQEDVLNVVHRLAGFTYGKADIFRRAMSGKLRSKESLETYQQDFIEGCLKNGLDETVTMQLWDQISSFSGYSFCKAHSASYAVLSFQETWLKAYYPTEFLCSVLNNYGGFYHHQEYINEAKSLDIEVLLPDVNRSMMEHSVEQDHVIRLGLASIKEVSEQSKNSLLTNRSDGGRFISIEDFTTRSGVTSEDGRILIALGACDLFGMKREQMQIIFASYTVDSSKAIIRKRKSSRATTTQTVMALENTITNFSLEHLSESSVFDDFLTEKQYLSYSVTNKPWDFIQKRPHVISSNDLCYYVKRRVTVLGYIAATKYATTKNGDSMCMLNLADAEGMIDVVVWNQEFKKYYSVITTSAVLEISGTVQESYGVLSLIAQSINRVDFSTSV